MYELIFAKRAVEELNKLETHIKERIWNKLQQAKESPPRFFEKLVEISGFKLILRRKSSDSYFNI